MDKKEEEREYTELSNVEKQRNYLAKEDYPDGPYGSPIRRHEPVELKSTPFRDEQRQYSNFVYENKTLHEDMPRQMEGSHPTHDDPDKSMEPPYDDYQK